MVSTKRLHLHFVGIGGVGMSGIAEVFHNQGYQVSGSDMNESETSQRLMDMGIRVSIGHSSGNVGAADVVVISSAVRPDNVEVVEARSRRIPVIPRAEMLGELMRGKSGIAVAGTHGKTTTTSMVSSILLEAGLDPTVVVGGKVNSLGGNAKLGQGHFVVAEADESDGSFLHLPATYAIVTNVDSDHLDHFGSLSKIDDAFVEFVDRLPFYGKAVVCGDDPGVQRILDRFKKPYVTYGFSEECDFRVSLLGFSGGQTRFQVEGPGVSSAVSLSVPGVHNALNAVAALALTATLGVPIEVAVRALSGYRGVRRRFDVIWKDESQERQIVDDYAHHPTEIRATLAAARQVWKGRIICVFQPHRYSRTLHSFSEFKTAFTDADVVFITDIYAAGEAPIQGVSGESLVHAIQSVLKEGQKILFAGSLDSARNLAIREFSNGDLLICMGAGSITRLPSMIRENA